MFSYNRGLLCQSICWSGKQPGISASIEFSSENSPKSKLMKITSVGSLAVRYANVNFPLPSLFPFSQKESHNSIYFFPILLVLKHVMLYTWQLLRHFVKTFSSRSVSHYGTPMSVSYLECLMWDIKSNSDKTLWKGLNTLCRYKRLLF
jgi:hypothetical protein